MIVLGDLNIDFLKWTQEAPANSNAYKVRPLVDNLFNQIFPYGVHQCVSVPTRFWPGVDPSGLDHIYTNKPEKLSDIHSAKIYKTMIIRHDKICL